jgi:hypothetical protein
VIGFKPGCSLCGERIHGDFYATTRYGYPRHPDCTEVWAQRNGRLEPDLVPNAVCRGLTQAWATMWYAHKRHPKLVARIIPRLPVIGWTAHACVRALGEVKR